MFNRLFLMKCFLLVCFSHSEKLPTFKPSNKTDPNYNDYADFAIGDYEFPSDDYYYHQEYDYNKDSEISDDYALSKTKEDTQYGQEQDQDFNETKDKEKVTIDYDYSKKNIDKSNSNNTKILDQMKNESNREEIVDINDDVSFDLLICLIVLALVLFVLIAVVFLIYKLKRWRNNSKSMTTVSQKNYISVNKEFI